MVLRFESDPDDQYIFRVAQQLPGNYSFAGSIDRYPLPRIVN